MSHEFRHVRVAGGGIPVFVAERAAGYQFADAMELWCWKSIQHGLECDFRGVGFERLSAILRNGCDVEPTTATMYVTSFLDKALEYGCGGDQVVQFFHQDHLARTYREVDADLPASELAELKKTFPTLVRSRDGTNLWLSRLQENDPRITTQDEWEYARWIPGNPFDALLAIVVIGVDFRATIERTEKAITGTSNGRWRLQPE